MEKYVTIAELRDYVLTHDTFNTNKYLEEHQVLPLNSVCNTINAIVDARKTLTDNGITCNVDTYNAKLKELTDERTYLELLLFEATHAKKQKQDTCTLEHGYVDNNVPSAGTVMHVCPWCGQISLRAK